MPAQLQSLGVPPLLFIWDGICIQESSPKPFPDHYPHKVIFPVLDKKEIRYGRTTHRLPHLCPDHLHGIWWVCSSHAWLRERSPQQGWQAEGRFLTHRAGLSAHCPRLSKDWIFGGAPIMYVFWSTCRFCQNILKTDIVICLLLNFPLFFYTFNL